MNAPVLENFDLHVTPGQTIALVRSYRGRKDHGDKPFDQIL